MNKGDNSTMIPTGKSSSTRYYELPRVPHEWPHIFGYFLLQVQATRGDAKIRDLGVQYDECYKYIVKHVVITNMYFGKQTMLFKHFDFENRSMYGG